MASSSKRKLYVGVDVGGTKILAVLAKHTGKVLARRRTSTPRTDDPADVVDTICELISGVLGKAGSKPGALSAIGLAVPGVVDPSAGRVVLTPNMSLTDTEIVPLLQKRWSVPVSLGNDANLGTLGEKWLGPARDAASVVGLFIGTGVGGGIYMDGRLLRGARECAGEIGHMVVQIDGPDCGCGAKGCFEALASRTAIERDLRAALNAGRKSALTDLMDDPSARIRSGVLKKALLAGDKLVTETLRRASEIIGLGCLSVRHILDPEAIVLGGGVVEACGWFMLPIIDSVIRSDPLTGARPGGRLLDSALGDDAVALGAVALAQMETDRDPFETVASRTVSYPTVEPDTPGTIKIDGQVHGENVFVRADGKVRHPKLANDPSYDEAGIGPKTLARVTKHCPQVLFVNTADPRLPDITEPGRTFLTYRGVTLVTGALEDVARQFNEADGRKAFLFHVQPD